MNYGHVSISPLPTLKQYNVGTLASINNIPIEKGKLIELYRAPTEKIGLYQGVA